MKHFVHSYYLLIVIWLMAVVMGLTHVQAHAQVPGNGDSNVLHASPDDTTIIDYSTVRDYVIGGIKISGTRYLDLKLITILSGLRVGDEIKLPGTEISNAIMKLWKQDLFAHDIIWKVHQK